MIEIIVLDSGSCILFEKIYKLNGRGVATSNFTTLKVGKMHFIETIY
jgi:hypothetical protein